jgi:hypothetical protein
MIGSLRVLPMWLANNPTHEHVVSDSDALPLKGRPGSNVLVDERKDAKVDDCTFANPVGSPQENCDVGPIRMHQPSVDFRFGKDHGLGLISLNYPHQREECP